MDEVPTTSLTVAKLKALCVLNDVSATGKKEELLLRLLEAGIDEDTLGITSKNTSATANHSAVSTLSGATSKRNGSPKNTRNEETVMLSLEDEETLTPQEVEVQDVKPKAEAKKELQSKTKPQVVAPVEEEVLEGEILEAIIVDEQPDEGRDAKQELDIPPTLRASKSEAMTLAQMLQRPQAVAVVLTLIILGAGGWYYLNNQLAPFTADSLRYGDSMGYIISGTADAYEESNSGALIATGEYVSLVTDQFEEAPDYCKVRLMFQGESEASITEGSSLELFTQTSDDRLGAVEVKGGQGMSWLSVEGINEMQFSQFDIFGHKKTNQKCNDFSEGTEGTADIKLTTWTELRERVTLASELEVSLSNSQGQYEGTVFTYGVGGLFGGLEDLSPGLGMVVAPIELEAFFGNAYITTDATGISSGWEWRVTGSEKVGATNMWKVTASHRDVRDFCLGYANMNLWLEANSPWAARQSVDIAISSSESSQNDCATWQQKGIEAILPEGELELHHSFERTFISRGVKAVELGKAYDNRPESNEFDPDDDELSDWGIDGVHLPDNSTERDHPLDVAMECLPEFSTVASGAVTALNNDGYVWRAKDSKNGSATEWNISWVAFDDTAGWLHFSVSGNLQDGLNCQYIGKGAYDDAVTYDRDAIPEALPVEAVEVRLMNAQRFPALTGPKALFTSSGYHDETSVGYLVVVPGTGFGINFGDLFKTDGTTTVDFQRYWEEDGAEYSFTALADATDGRLIGWTQLRTVIS